MALDLGRPATRALPTGDLFGALAGWRRGLVFVLCQGREEAEPVVRRRLNLANFIDRIELDHLGTAPVGGAVLRAHRLDAEGQLTVMRAMWPACGGPTWSADRLPDGDGRRLF